VDNYEQYGAATVNRSTSGNKEITSADGAGLSGKPLGWGRVTDAPELLDIGDAARFLNVSETSLRRWTNAGILSCLRVGRRRERRFRRGDLLTFMEQPAAAQHVSADRQASGQMRDSTSDAIVVTHPSHLCGIYGSDAGRIQLYVPFLVEGLRQGSVCVFYAPGSTQKAILKNLGDVHPTLSSDIKERRLIMSEQQKSARAQWKHLEAQLVRAKKSGASSFRVLGEMTGMRQRSSGKELLELEASLDQKITSRFPVSMLCAYDAREFSGVELLNALKTHRDTFRYPVGRTLA
jgi:excisionase family DNA binding protein